MSQETALPKDTAELLDRIEREWSALMRVVDELTPEQMITPGTGGWSVKDNLAHLTAWEQFMLLHYLQGRPPHDALQIDAATLDQLDETGTNAVIYERNRDRPTADVLGDLRRSHAQVVAFLEQLPFASLIQPLYPDDPQARPIIGWVIGNTYEHYQEHRLYIQTIMGK